MSPDLSVVMPVYNEAPHLPATLDALLESLRRTELEAELVLVDDGSTDESAAVAADVCADRIPLRIVARSNSGRFAARRAGVEAATGDWVLLLDGRLTLAPGALSFVTEHARNGERVWTGHVDMDVDGNPYGTFWKLLAELAWRDYFERPRTTSFGAAEFDRFPKGTGCFFAPRTVLLDAIDAFHSRYSDLRNANDDAPLIRWIAEREPVHVSPRFGGLYAARARLAPFVRHAFHRGIVFLDGHGRPESRFFPAVVAFYPAATALALATVRRPVVAPVAAAVVGIAAGALGLRRRRSPFEVATLAALAPVYAVAHGAGMWRGLALLVRDRGAAR